MDVDEQKPIVPKPRDLDSNFVDDDDLQAALARSRRAKLQKPKKLKPEEIAQKREVLLNVEIVRNTNPSYSLSCYRKSKRD